MPAIASRGSGGSLFPPGYVDYDNAGGILTIVGFVTALALLAVLLRIYVRAVMLKVFGLDDYLIILAMCLSTIVLVCFTEETHYGLGKHFVVAVSNPVAWTKFLTWNWAHAIIIVVSNSTLKISIACFLMRITARLHYHRFLLGVIIFIILFTIASVGTLLFQCLPVSAAWDSSLRPPPLGHGTASCYSSIIFRDIGVFNSCVIMATDVLFASLPVPLIWSLQLNARQKISLICTLCLGFFSCAASLVKTVLQYNIFKDPDWTTHDSFAVWFAIEVNVGILAASLPALKPLLTWALDPTKRSLAGTPGHTGSGSGNSSNGSRKTASTFGGRSSNIKGVGKLGYWKQPKEMDMPMPTLDNETFGVSFPHREYEASITSGEFFSEASIGTALTSEGKRESGMDSAWIRGMWRGSGDSILPLQGRAQDERNGIIKTTEVRFG